MVKLVNPEGMRPGEIFGLRNFACFLYSIVRGHGPLRRSQTSEANLYIATVPRKIDPD